MGERGGTIAQSVIEEAGPPKNHEFELTLFGPGYGESIVLHVGDGVWVIVDSCVADDGAPRALKYLEEIGIDPGEAVALIVATHWHDDHIRGMAKLVEQCRKALFCCSEALCKKEFLSVVGTIERRHGTETGSGVRELFRVFTHLGKTNRQPMFAGPDRCLMRRGGFQAWSLSPSDRAFHQFLAMIGSLTPRVGDPKVRVPDQSPNEVAIALWIEVDDVLVLLGSDVERQGWLEILSSPGRPAGKASAFKVPHHGSANAHEPSVWQDMLEPDPVVVLTPWRRGRGALPTAQDVTRLLSLTSCGYASSKRSSVQDLAFDGLGW